MTTKTLEPISFGVNNKYFNKLPIYGAIKYKKTCYRTNIEYALLTSNSLANRLVICDNQLWLGGKFNQSDVYQIMTCETGRTARLFCGCTGKKMSVKEIKELLSRDFICHYKSFAFWDRMALYNSNLQLDEPDGIDDEDEQQVDDEEIEEIEDVSIEELEEIEKIDF